MTSSEERTIQAMVQNAMQQLRGLNIFRDHDIVTLLMRCGVDKGFGLNQLQLFEAAYGTGCFGFSRDKEHFAGISRFTDMQQAITGLLVGTSGKFKGVWIFLLDTDKTVLTRRDSQAVSSFAGLEGLDLIRAVIYSALTEDLKPAKRRLFGRH